MSRPHPLYGQMCWHPEVQGPPRGHPVPRGRHRREAGDGMSRIPTRPKPLGGECENCGRPNQAPYCPDCYHALPECITCRHRVPAVDDARQCPTCARMDSDEAWISEREAWAAKYQKWA